MDRSPRRDDDLPEVVPDTSLEALSQAELYRKYGFDGGEGKYPYVFDLKGDKYTPPKPPTGDETELPSQAYRENGEHALQGRKKVKICGVRRKTLWILVGVAVLVIVAIAVGTGVGASSGSRSGSRDSGAREQDAGSSQASSVTTFAASSSILSTDTASPTMASASSTSNHIQSSTSSASQETPTFLNNQTAPAGWAFQGFSDRNYGGEAGPVIVHGLGYIDLGFDANSYGPATDIGYWCEDRRQTAASEPFDRVNIWCGQDRETQIRRCSLPGSLGDE